MTIETMPFAKALNAGLRKAMEDDPRVLLEAVISTGLDEARAREILSGDEYTQQVREQQAYYRDAGINSVPAVVFNERHLVSGGQPVEVYEQVMRDLAAA